jgi:hypothetical protein
MLMKTLSVLALVTLMVLFPMRSDAQVASGERPGNVSPSHDIFGLGFTIAPAGGVGLSFRHHLPAPFSYQVVGGIIRATDRLYYSVGVQGEYDLSRGSMIRFYAALGYAYFYSGVDGKNDMKGPSRLGLGIGAETELMSGFHIKGELLFTWFSDGIVLPLPGAGIHYYF